MSNEEIFKVILDAVFDLEARVRTNETEIKKLRELLEMTEQQKTKGTPDALSCSTSPSATSSIITEPLSAPSKEYEEYSIKTVARGSIKAKDEQECWWDIFERILCDKGEPFTFCNTVSGEIKFFASVNKRKARAPLAVTIDFLVRERIVKLQVYIENNTKIYDYLYGKRQLIEQELGWAPEWVTFGKRNPNTRRIVTTFPIEIGNEEDYERVANLMIPYVTRYIHVFGHYAPQLFDF